MHIRRHRRVVLAFCLVIIVFTVSGISALVGQVRPPSTPNRPQRPHAKGATPRETPFYQDHRRGNGTDLESRTPLLSPAEASTPSNRLDELGIDEIEENEVGADEPAQVFADKTPLPFSATINDSESEGQEETRLVSTAEGGGRVNRRSGWGASLFWAGGILLAGLLARHYLVSHVAFENGASSPIEVLSRQSIGPQQQLLLLSFGQKLLLVGVTPSGLSTLSTIDAEEEVQSILEQMRSASSERSGTKLHDLFRMLSPRNERSFSPPASIRVSTTTRTTPTPRGASGQHVSSSRHVSQTQAEEVADD